MKGEIEFLYLARKIDIVIFHCENVKFQFITEKARWFQLSVLILVRDSQIKCIHWSTLYKTKTDQ